MTWGSHSGSAMTFVVPGVVVVVFPRSLREWMGRRRDSVLMTVALMCLKVYRGLTES